MLDPYTLQDDCTSALAGLRSLDLQIANRLRHEGHNNAWPIWLPRFLNAAPQLTQLRLTLPPMPEDANRARADRDVFYGDGMYDLASDLTLEHLATLQLTNMHGDVEPFIALLKSLAPTLRTLELNDCYLPSRGWGAFLRYCGDSMELENLRIAFSLSKEDFDTQVSRYARVCIPDTIWKKASKSVELQRYSGSGALQLVRFNQMVEDIVDSEEEE